jgi:hypothetical protein
MSFGIYLLKKHWPFFLSISIVSTLIITAIYLALTNLSYLVTFFFCIVVCIFAVIIAVVLIISLLCLKEYLKDEYSDYKETKK